MTQVSFPSRCAVSVVCGEHLVSQVYPASVPVEAFVDSVVELIHDDLKRRGAGGLDASESYELQRANGSRLDVTKTLDELGVEDGATLVLSPAVDGESFEPHYESLSTGLARIGIRLVTPVTAESAARTALAIVGMVILTVIGLAISVRSHSDSWVPALVTGPVALLTAAGAIWVRRWWPARTDLLDGLAWLAAPSLATSLALTAPGPLGAPHAFIAAVAMAAAVLVITLATDRHVVAGATVITLSAIGGLVAAARMMAPVPHQWIGMGVLVGLIFVLTMAPTIALWSARIRPPHFGSITGRDLFRRGDGMAPDAVSPVNDKPDVDSDADSTPSGEAISRAARRANSVLTGICTATAVVLPSASWASLMPGGHRGGAAAVLVALLVWIFISRARVFTDRRQAIALVIGAAATVCAAVVRYVIAFDARPAALAWGVAVLGGFAAAALGAALLVPATKFTPLVRMTVEWLELVAIVVALPLAAWIGGLFAWIRMR